ncbi:MAG: serine/threonine-protein phosphatase [Nitrospirae bacterium]|nr:MAG: serine/threonine-protein phosphatase [Nitrospirota bacterium]
MNSLFACGKTDIGLKRHRNEDNYAVEPECGLFVVADGMGGHAGGDTASSMAIETVRNFIKTALSDQEITWPFGMDHSLPREINIISSGMRLANRYIFNASKGMGTTMVALLVRDNKAYICHAGDSRLYRIRGNSIEQITEDHSLAAEEIRRGTLTREQARNYSLKHVITRAIGINADITCDCRVENIMSGDIFLLCSDGLSGMLEDAELLDIIKGSPPPLAKDEGGLLEEGCARLIRRANEKGGHDNITAILVKFK